MGVLHFSKGDISIEEKRGHFHRGATVAVWGRVSVGAVGARPREWPIPALGFTNGATDLDDLRGVHATSGHYQQFRYRTGMGWA
jgi:hypothetical protein